MRIAGRNVTGPQTLARALVAKAKQIRDRQIEQAGERVTGGVVAGAKRAADAAEAARTNAEWELLGDRYERLRQDCDDNDINGSHLDEKWIVLRDPRSRVTFLDEWEDLVSQIKITKAVASTQGAWSNQKRHLWDGQMAKVVDGEWNGGTVAFLRDIAK